MADILLTSVIGGSTSGTVTSVSVVTANGVSGSVATATTTPAITLTLGDITPTSVNSTFTGNGAAITTLNAGNISSGTLAVARGGTGLGSYTTNNILYATDSTTLAGLATANNGILVTNASGVPSISSTLPDGITLSAVLNTVSATVSAAGSTQGTATSLTSDFNVVTTVSANTGVKLPNPSAGRTVIVVNKGANALRVYPDTSDIIDALSANVHISVPVNGWISFNSISATQWYSTSNATVNVSLASGTLAVANGGTGTTTSTGTAGSVVLSISPVIDNGSGTTSATASASFTGGSQGAVGIYNRLSSGALNPAVAASDKGIIVDTGSQNTGNLFIGNWSSTANGIRLTAAGTHTVYGTLQDSNSFEYGYRDIPQNIQNATYSFALTDRGRSVGKTNSTAYTYTIPANSSVAFPAGSVITVFNNNATSNITIAITTDTLRLAGTTTTGSRTLAPWGVATLYKSDSTTWLASGAGLT